jgi:hypothetical protein
VHRRKAESPLLPQGSSLLSELCCLGPSSLNRPHPSHSQAHRDFAAWRLIRDVFAVRKRRGDPRVVPSFRGTFLPDMPPTTTAGSPYIVSSKFTMPTWSSPHPSRLDTPKTPTIRRELHFRGFTGLQLLRPARLLASPRRIRLGHDPATGGFYIQAFDGAVALRAAGYDYDIDWSPLSAGLAPAGMAASFAALGWRGSRPASHRGLSRPRQSARGCPRGLPRWAPARLGFP